MLQSVLELPWEYEPSADGANLEQQWSALLESTKDMQIIWVAERQDLVQRK